MRVVSLLPSATEISLCEACTVSLNVVGQAATELPKEPHVLSMNPASLGEVLKVTVKIGDAVERGEEARDFNRTALGQTEGAAREATGAC